MEGLIGPHNFNSNSCFRNDRQPRFLQRVALVQNQRESEE